MNKLFKILLTIFIALIAFLSAFLIYYSIDSKDTTNEDEDDVEDFYDENLDPDGWI